MQWYYLWSSDGFRCPGHHLALAIICPLFGAEPLNELELTYLWGTYLNKNCIRNSNILILEKCDLPCQPCTWGRCVVIKHALAILSSNTGIPEDVVVCAMLFLFPNTKPDVATLIWYNIWTVSYKINVTSLLTLHWGCVPCVSSHLWYYLQRTWQFGNSHGGRWRVETSRRHQNIRMRHDYHDASTQVINIVYDGYLWWF